MKSLEVQLMMTSKCNLNCTYCYIKQSNTFLTIKDFENFYSNMLDKFLNEYNCLKYHIVFFGGEPTLSWDRILQITNIFKHDKRLNYIKLVTNGSSLDKQKQKWVINNKVRLSVSHDGIWQEINRPGVSIDLCKLSNDINITNIHCMLTPKNLPTLLDNYLYFKKLNIIPSFTIVEDDIWNDESIVQYKKYVSKLTDFIIKHFDNWAILPGIYEYWINKIAFPKKNICSIGESVSLFPGGKIYPCARYGNANDSPLNIGNSLHVGNIDYFNITKLTNNYNECKVCDIVNICTSGCHYVQSKHNKPIGNICKIYKFTLNETMRISNELSKNKNFLKYIEKVIK